MGGSQRNVISMVYSFYIGIFLDTLRNKKIGSCVVSLNANLPSSALYTQNNHDKSKTQNPLEEKFHLAENYMGERGYFFLANIDIFKSANIWLRLGEIVDLYLKSQMIPHIYHLNFQYN